MEGSKPAEPDTSAATASTPAVATTSSNRESAPDTEAPTTLNQIRYPCLTNMDYHGTREAWLDQLHRWLMFGVICSGAFAFVDTWPAMKFAGPIIAVICGSLDLTFDLSNRARAHAMFRRRYSEILSEATKTPDRLQTLRCKLDELSGEEEPAFHSQFALSAMKGQQATYGRVVDPCRPGWPYRVLANIWRFDGRDFNQS